MRRYEKPVTWEHIEAFRDSDQFRAWETHPNRGEVFGSSQRINGIRQKHDLFGGEVISVYPGQIKWSSYQFVADVIIHPNRNRYYNGTKNGIRSTQD